MTAATARVFFALWPAPEIAAKLAEIAAMASQVLGGKPTRCETIHLTLAFLGDVPEAQLPLLCSIASQIRGRSFDLTMDRLGFWRHNHLLWAGCSIAPPALPALADDLSAALQQGGFAVTNGKHAFAPHVTLLRKVAADAALASVCPLPEFEALHWRCDDFVLVRSRQSSAGSSYESLARFPLIS
jgi:2'-5' RNA ligase